MSQDTVEVFEFYTDEEFAALEAVPPAKRLELRQSVIDSFLTDAAAEAAAAARKSLETRFAFDEPALMARVEGKVREVLAAEFARLLAP